MARRLRTVLREEDTLARLGGDEFAAIVVNVADVDAIENLMDRLLTAVAEPVWVADHMVETNEEEIYRRQYQYLTCSVSDKSKHGD